MMKRSFLMLAACLSIVSTIAIHAENAAPAACAAERAAVDAKKILKRQADEALTNARNAADAAENDYRDLAKERDNPPITQAEIDAAEAARLKWEAAKTVLSSAQAAANSANIALVTARTHSRSAWDA